MKWGGKAIGGALGASIGGPLGAGVGAAIGHLLADTDDAGLKLHQVGFEHHQFSEDGPGMVVTPRWEAWGLEGVDVTVKLAGGGEVWTEVVVPEAKRERCELPPFFLPYALFSQSEARLVVTLSSDEIEPVKSKFTLELPTPLRQLGNNGPAREVMALMACARAGDHPVGLEMVRYIRTTFTAARPLSELGITWLKNWMKELRDLELERLEPGKVAERVGSSLDETEQERLLDWMVAGAEQVWPTAAAREFLENFGKSLGLPVPWREAMALPQTTGRARQILGVREGASQEDIKIAWRRLVQEHHPDRAADPALATRKTAQLNAAWELLRSRD